MAWNGVGRTSNGKHVLHTALYIYSTSYNILRYIYNAVSL